MKALTISQPYADLISHGDKWIENRTWSTNYSGVLAIHAGKGSQYLSAIQLQKFDTGAIVAVAQLRSVIHIASLLDPSCVAHGTCLARTGRTAVEILQHRHCEGPWCWVLSGVIALPEPIKFRGAQGLWDVPLDVQAKIERAIRVEAKE